MYIEYKQRGTKMSEFSRAFGRGFGEGFGFGMAANFFGFHPYCCNTFNYWSMPMMSCCSWNIFQPMPIIPMPMPFNGVSYRSCCCDTFESSAYISPAYKGNGTKDKKVKEADEQEIIEAKVVKPEISDEAKTLCSRWQKMEGVKDKRLTPEFCQKVIDIAAEIPCEYEDLMAIMYVESRFSHQFTSKSDDKDECVGLIRFKHSDRTKVDGMDVTISELKEMSAIRQLDYVKEYIIKHKGDATGKLDLETLANMLCTDGVYAKEGTKAYRRNSSFDTDYVKPDSKRVPFSTNDEGVLVRNRKTEQGVPINNTITNTELLDGLKATKERIYKK